MPLFPVSAIPSASVGYEIDNSLRFNDDDSAYLSRTPASTSSSTKLTCSFWVKISENSGGNGGTIFGTSGNYYYGQFYNQSLYFGNTASWVSTGAVFRDYASWYHVIFVVDTTLATSNDRMKIYVNGIRQAVGTFNTQPSQSSTFEWLNSSALSYQLGSKNGSVYFDGYLAEVNFIDGQALTPSDFGETGDYGEFKPIKYSGTYGTNGFYLDFKNSGSLGNDASSNSNNWTLNNLSATDQMIDTPTNNFATVNDLSGSNWLSQSGVFTLKEGGLSFTVNNVGAMEYASFAMESGKWYWEIAVGTGPYGYAAVQSIRAIPTGSHTYALYGSNRGIYHYPYNSTSGSQTTANVTTAYVANQTIISMAFDADGGEIKWYRDNVLVHTESSIVDDTYVPSFGAAAAISNWVVNFGQDSSFAGGKTAQGNQDSNGIGDFYYTPPSGFLALCTQNLPAPAVIPSEHFNIITWSGDGNNNRSLTGVGFQPDFVWFKARNIAHNYRLEDSVRGASAGFLSSDNTAVEETRYGQVVGFGSDGFTVGFTSQDIAGANFSGHNYVAWNWKAGGAGTSVAESGTGDGSINAHTYSANTSAGFSIVKYEGRGDEISASFHTKVGHGLSVAPEMVMIKSRDNVRGWAVMSEAITGAASWQDTHLRLDTTAALSGALYVSSSAPDSTHFYVGDDGIVNAVSENYIAYCFHSVEGYSKVSSYTGNGSADGTFVHTGFRPAYVMLKSTASAEWILVDNARNPTNEVDNILTADDSSSEAAFGTANRNLDFLSNGFKIRETAAGGTTAMNASSATYIYLAFAESPFKHSNAR